MVLAMEPGSPELSRYASAGGPHPAASVGSGGRSPGSSGSLRRREGRLAPRIASALRASRALTPLVSSGEVARFATWASNAREVLRETLLPSTATPLRECLRVAKESSNPATAPVGYAAGKEQQRSPPLSRPINDSGPEQEMTENVRGACVLSFMRKQT